MKGSVILVPSCFKQVDFPLLADSDKTCDHPLPTLSVPLLYRQQGLYDKILMTLDLHNHVSHQHIFYEAMHLLRLALGGIL